MSKNYSLVLIALFASAAVALAADSAATIQLGRISPSDGQGMYAGYCAPCHGISGRGNGSLAVTHKIRVPDLTTLSIRNGGSFPANHVTGLLGYGASGHVHSNMPEWGPALGKIDWANKMDTPLRISNLTKYLQTLQTK